MHPPCLYPCLYPGYITGQENNPASHLKLPGMLVPSVSPGTRYPPPWYGCEILFRQGT